MLKRSRSKKGATLVVYSMLVGFIAVATVTAVSGVGGRISRSNDTAIMAIKDNITDVWFSTDADMAFRLVAEKDPNGSRVGYLHDGSYGKLTVLWGEDRMGAMHAWNLYYDKPGMSGGLLRCRGMSDRTLGGAGHYNGANKGNSYTSGMVLSDGAVYECQVFAP